MIVDCHVHVWELPPFAPVGPTAPTWNTETKEAGPIEVLVDEMAENGVDAAVLVQSSGSTWDNSYVAHSTNRWPDRFKSIGLVDPTDPENAMISAKWMDDYGVAGFRFHPDYYPNDVVLDPERNGAMFSEIERRGGIVKVHNRVANVDQMSQIVPNFPGITWIVDHMMYPEPEMSRDGWQAYRPVLDLAQHPNVIMMISDVHNRSNEGFPYSDMHDAVKSAIDAFGIERCIWGTGYPGDLRVKHGWITLAEELRLIRKGFDWLSAGEVDALLGGTAQRVYGF